MRRMLHSSSSNGLEQNRAESSRASRDVTDFMPVYPSTIVRWLQAHNVDIWLDHVMALCASRNLVVVAASRQSWKQPNHDS